ncbi:hypothetical protein B0T17DRAFT_508032 [Bombardia bombarda]|uniref:Uncharacterized protein n=1 Tax=Bombardia bombarda TaxID=252184 RepID=A0AA39X0H9_9PEZI|nr:hypothetical protein B0T17DRAFT_508032 [Bombardia bombarda]
MAPTNPAVTPTRKSARLVNLAIARESAELRRSAQVASRPLQYGSLHITLTGRVRGRPRSITAPSPSKNTKQASVSPAKTTPQKTAASKKTATPKGTATPKTTAARKKTAAPKKTATPKSPPAKKATPKKATPRRRLPRRRL